MVTLTQSQLSFYRDGGYLHLKAAEHDLVSPAELQQWTDDVRTWPLEKGKWMPYFEITPEGKRQLMRTEKFVDYHPQWKELICGDALGSILAQLAGEETILFKDKINYKLPGGNGFHAHIDYNAYSHIAQIPHLTANVAVDDATLANGCLEVVPGSHRMEIEFSQGGRISPEWEARQDWVSVPLASGDILFFGSVLAHQSKENATDKSRSSLYATFAMRKDGEDLRQKYYEHRRRIFPPDHEREENRDYSAGFKQYAFAAPFTKTDAGKV
ncbi:hypothetical protein BDV59DRAFT_197943 [Aspergillus ambiguus]|uniref:phytanoyl-CoA dioxygenase family protein n=1 Tax=Aspergillus ambiguus TaxID=176160 RepID=UPI003CCD99A9